MLKQYVLLSLITFKKDLFAARFTLSCISHFEMLRFLPLFYAHQTYQPKLKPQPLDLQDRLILLHGFLLLKLLMPFLRGLCHIFKKSHRYKSGRLTMITSAYNISYIVHITCNSCKLLHSLWII